MKRQILVATGNPGKLKELQTMLDLDINWKTLNDFPDVQEVCEDGETFQDNARKKALGYAKQTGLWTLADDSGLVIDALSGAPGVHSARFAGGRLPGEDRRLADQRNNHKVLELLKDIPPDKRMCRFVCHLCLASPDTLLLEAQGTLEGTIIDTPLGSNGFGYDPIFFIPALGKTAAQLPPDQKNAYSHRGNALRELKIQLNALLEKSHLPDQ